MEIESNGSDAFLRIDHGEDIVAAVALAVDRLSLPAAVITSGVGSLDTAELAFASVGRTTLAGIFEISALTGNVIRRGGIPLANMHAIMNDTTHRTRSGQLVSARCHTRTEVFLSVVDLAVTRNASMQVTAPKLAARPPRPGTGARGRNQRPTRRW